MAFDPATFTIGARDFELDGAPFRVISGALHYFRVHPEQWADRIHKARLMGLNTIETYVAWNAHAPQRDAWRTEDGLDLVHFLELVAAEGMRAIVRPGPYICAEWDGGGLPAWLFQDGAVRIRSSDPQFLTAVGEYFGRLLPMLEPLQVQHGGPIILMQVENEYGAYGNDSDYLDSLTEMMRAGGITVPLTTIDQPVDQMLRDGGRPGLHRTGSFGSRAVERFATLRAHQPDGPLMCAEFWDGWFDSWGGYHHVTDAQQSAAELRAILSAGGSVNFYMFHGGTNFGFTNGANDKGVYEPIVTSYDYDAPLDESGAPTEKYWAYREVIAEFAEVADDRPGRREAAPELEGRFTAAQPLLDLLAAGEPNSGPPTFGQVGATSGFVMYRTEIDVSGRHVLAFAEVRDRALISLNGAPVGAVVRGGELALTLPSDASGTLEVLVEDMGRVDYGPRIGEAKGLIGPVTLSGVPLERWEAAPVDLERLRLIPGVPVSTLPVPGPVIAHASFVVTESRDLFLDTQGWGRGVVWVNGFCLGRYWARSPQRTLYVPAPVVRAGDNELVVFELHALAATPRFVSAPELGPIEV